MLKHSRAPWSTAERNRDITRIIDADGWTVGNVNTEDAPLIVHAPDMRDELRSALWCLRKASEAAGDVPEWNEGGESYEAVKAIKSLLSACDREGE